MPNYHQIAKEIEIEIEHIGFPYGTSIVNLFGHLYAI